MFILMLVRGKSDSKSKEMMRQLLSACRTSTRKASMAPVATSPAHDAKHHTASQGQQLPKNVTLALFTTSLS